jgi:hypothetical protein
MVKLGDREPERRAIRGDEEAGQLEGRRGPSACTSLRRGK